MDEWIDVHKQLPEPNIVVVGLAQTPDFSNVIFPAIVGIDPTRGWITWPNQELCYVFKWKPVLSSTGGIFKLFKEKEEDQE